VGLVRGPDSEQQQQQQQQQQQHEEGPPNGPINPSLLCLLLQEAILDLRVHRRPLLPSTMVLMDNPPELNAVQQVPEIQESTHIYYMHDGRHAHADLSSSSIRRVWLPANVSTHAWMGPFLQLTCTARVTLWLCVVSGWMNG
jgi:hypothetical protein